MDVLSSKMHSKQHRPSGGCANNADRNKCRPNKTSSKAENDDSPYIEAKTPRLEAFEPREASRVHEMGKHMSKSELQTRAMWRRAKAVCFDVDSTVCQDEAIDELAKFCGVGDLVSAWTIKAMNGGYSFREALTARLNIIKPSRIQLNAFIRKNPPKFTPEIQELTRELERRGVSVYLVSGGFSSIILPAAKLLGVADENVFANVLHFDEAGGYVGFDDSQPTSDSGGKTRVCGMLKRKLRLADPLVMVGDGATDMEAAPPADAFVGFGGNQVRERVKAEASWFVYSFAELLAELKRDY